MKELSGRLELARKDMLNNKVRDDMVACIERGCDTSGHAQTEISNQEEDTSSYPSPAIGPPAQP